MPRSTIHVHESEKITTIENKVEIREVERHQLKVIENSDAWKEHMKHHQGAQLTMLGSKDEKGLGQMEKDLVQEKKKQDEKAVDEIAKKPQDPLEQTKFSYQPASKTEEKSTNRYGHSHGSGTILGACNCGQVFKADEEGVSPYKLNAQAQAVTPMEAMGYKKKEGSSGAYHKKDAIDELQTPAYGRR